MEMLTSQHQMWLLFLLEVILCSYLVDTARPYINDLECPRRPHKIPSDRTCLKKCRSDWNCKGKSRRCLCDGDCGRTCVKPAMKCHDLQDIPNGHFYINPFNIFSARVQYACDVGYILKGPKERVCQGDGKWGGQDPTCEATETCSNPAQVPNGIHNGAEGQTVFPLGTKLYYTCLPGYIMDGYNNATCVAQEVWMGPKMHCSPIRCRPPVDIPHAKIEGDIFMYPNKIMYRCLEGYQIRGKPYRICQENGLWSGSTPSCIPISCSKPQPIKNGQVTARGLTYGSEVIYTCHHGYRIKGHSIRTCLKDGDWSFGETSCDLVDCGSTEPFYNGYNNTARTKFGSTVLFRCYGWATFEGESNTTSCRVDGTWSHPVPKCWAECTIPEVQNGNVTFHKPGEKVPHGKIVQYHCKDGFQKEHEDSLVCQNGTFTLDGNVTDLPKCTPKPCLSRPTSIRDGMVRYYSVNHGDKAKYKCNTGYRMIGKDFSQCQFGKWKGQAPICEPDYCKHPGNIANGKILLVGVKGKFEYREYVSTVEHTERVIFKCNSGYKRLGPRGSTCVDGKWSPKIEKTKCVPGQHRNLDRHVILYRGKRSIHDAISGG